MMPRAAAIDRIRSILEAAGEKSALHLHEAKRQLAKRDLFYLLTGPLKRRDLNRDWLFDRCREVQAKPDNHIDLWARGHGKSSIITFGLTIFEILNDPGITIGIFSDTNKVAKAFLRQIKSEFEMNEDLKKLFPEIFWANPRKEAPKWSEDEGIVVKRTGNPKEQTVEAFGLLDGQPTGRHFKLRVYDDVVTVDTVGTADQIEKVSDRLALSDNLGSENGRKRYIGTFYHAADSYVRLIKTGTVTPRIYPATADGTETGDPVLLSTEELARKRRTMGPYVFSCQMLLNPTADKMAGFREEWLRYWPGTNLDGLNTYLLVDPASGKHKDRGDYTSMWVVGIGSDGNRYVIDGVRDRLNLTARAAHVMRLHRKYKPLAVGYESYGLQADIEHVKDLQDRENYRFPIIELGGSMKKIDRIKRLVPLFEQGQIHLPASLVRYDAQGKAYDLTRVFIEDEYSTFPVCEHDDMLDCLARITEEEALSITAPQPKESEITDDYQQQRRATVDTDWLMA